MTNFNGFSKKTITYLKNLGANNNKIWFEAHRNDYEDFLIKPLQELVVELGEFMLTIDPDFETKPVINKTISRIYRDTRFSKDKSPYKTAMWITFKRPNKEWHDAPAYFFEITPESYRYGMGMYCASKKTMDIFRQRIDNQPERFQEAISFLNQQKDFVVAGEKYKRILNKENPQEIQEWYQRKNVFLVSNHKIDKRIFNKILAQDIAAGFSLIAPFYNYLWQLKY